MAFFEPITICALTLACLASPDAPAAQSAFNLSLHETTGRMGMATLSCDPAGGNHPKADVACAALIAADGDFTKLPTRPQACTLIYSPVDVTAAGTWKSKPVTYRATYGNLCLADTQTSGVFAF